MLEKIAYIDVCIIYKTNNNSKEDTSAGQVVASPEFLVKKMKRRTESWSDY